MLLTFPLPLPGAAALPLPLLAPALAAPVNWQELPATSEGRQWWDRGSLRFGRDGSLFVLSRFQPSDPQVSQEVSAPGPDKPADPLRGQGRAQAPPGAIIPSDVAAAAGPTSAGAETAGDQARRQPATLYVMELDCGLELYRDISVNGLPRFRAPWRPADGDDLALATLRAACAAWDAQADPARFGSDPSSHA